ncbi:hypothetical protein [Paractinoplanes durhamensis]|uniref:Twin-arginine translocation pathway signal n=1 Tax=Paractinoplanes durhamensis TaxID=113563 RepID=A0ABQ3ZCA0_9ACTN|nr:hypothetical protein [Actinoplanes durhamensis]GIE07440.1 hypothetical protein Adu01nite_87900 [Actinoplanes durhamensis]
MARITRRELMNILGAFGLVAVLAGLALGLPAVDRAFSAERPLQAGVPVDIGAGVTVVPPAGATLDVTGTRPGGSMGSAFFRLGAVQYKISVRPFDGDLETAAARLRQRITGNQGYQVTSAQLAVDTVDGLAGLQGGYTAPGRGGRYAVFVGDGRTIEILISGNDLDLGATLPQIEASTRTLRIDGTAR